MGCIARLGCLILLAILAVIGWFTRDRWMPASMRSHAVSATKSPAWEPLSDAGAKRTETALGKLSQQRGPVFQTLSGADAASYIFRERVQFTGTLRVVKPGLAEFQIQEIKVGAVNLPRGMIAGLIGRFDRGQRPAGLDRDALPLPIPRYVGDIRVANGKITLYK